MGWYVLGRLEDASQQQDDAENQRQPEQNLIIRGFLSAECLAQKVKDDDVIKFTLKDPREVIASLRLKAE